MEADEKTQARKKQMRRRFEALKSEQSTWLPRWKTIAENIRPWGFRQFTTDDNRGKENFSNIINDTPLEAARTLSSGMMTGISSPSRPWFRIVVRTADPTFSERHAVKQWASEVERLIREALSKSNVYKGLHLVYSDIGPFAIGTLFIDESEDEDVCSYSFPVGSYVLACGRDGKVDTIYRELSMTVGQLVKMFGEENCSQTTKNQFKSGNVDQRVACVHAIEPNDEYEAGRVGAKGKKWASIWWESGSNDTEGFLRVSGYDEFPLMAPRWEVTGQDAYGSNSPGFAAVGDCKALQLLERRCAQAVDKVVNPPMVGPASARTATINMLPGEWSFIDALGQGQSVRPAIEINPNAINIFTQKIQEHERRIRRQFFADLWLLLSESTGQMTAREVSERREEKLQQLGPVMEGLMGELLDPLIIRVFNILWRRGRIPPPPPELEGMEWRAEYISIMAQAQKMLSTTNIERLASFTAGLAQTDPTIMDKVDLDQMVDEYADALGVAPAIVRPDEDVATKREQRAQVQQQQLQAQQAQQMAQTGKTLADTQIENGNALSTMLKGVGAG